MKRLPNLNSASRQVAAIGCCLLAFGTPATAGTSYGIYDARTLAMGGAAVASAVNDNAQFYNAALLAFNEEIEERTEDSRFLFPLIITQIAESIITLEELSQNDTSGKLSRAVQDYNMTPNAQNAQAVVDASNDLDGAFADLENEDLFADVYLGVAVSEPGDLRGAGFFMGTRLLAGGATTVSPADRATLDAYQEGLLFVASNGAQGVAHPELFDANGDLIDPGNDYDSSASAAGLAITEAGVAVSHQFQFLGGPIAAGFSFKVQRIDTFEDTQRVVDNRIDTERNSESEGNINFDLGFVKPIGKHWRAAIAVKDIIAHDYATSQGTAIRLRPRARLGVAYQKGRMQLAADTDVTKNEPLGSESATQEAALGAEWTFAPLGKLRAGYRYDFQGKRNEVMSIGAGTVWKRLAVDFAYAQGSNTRAAALQFGIVF